MKKSGRDISEIKTVFLTHSHPDHIGGAAAIKQRTNCELYASGMEKAWIENIDIQFKERPIPNFYTLVKESVQVEQTVKENDRFMLEDGITIKVVETPGHSKGSVSYIWEEGKAIFCGDSIPVMDDFPIFVDEIQSENSIKKIESQKDLQICCPAWDRIYVGDEIVKICQERLELLEKLKQCVCQIMDQNKTESQEEKRYRIGESMGWGHGVENPLFQKSIEACLHTI